MNMRKMWVATAGALFALGVVAGSSARADEKVPVIAVVDVQYIMHESSAGKSIEKAMKEKGDAYNKELSDRDAKLRQIDQDLTKQHDSMSSDAFNKKRQDLQNQATELSRDAQARRKTLEQGLNDAMVTLQNALKEVISTVAQEHGITVLLSRQQVMFLADKKMDVTEEVLTGINKKLPSVKVTFPAPQK